MCDYNIIINVFNQNVVQLFNLLAYIVQHKFLNKNLKK